MKVSDQELLRRYRVLYPKPTKYQTASIAVMEKALLDGGEEADEIRRKLLVRMGDVSEFMKAVKQRFSVWFNRSHNRFGTLWADRFKSVLVEGAGNPLQTMAAYIDLNPVRAGLAEDPKDYRFCGYAESVAGHEGARSGLKAIWAAYADGELRASDSVDVALQAHRELIFGKHAGEAGLSEHQRDRALRVLNEEKGVLSRAGCAALSCPLFYGWSNSRERRVCPELC